MTDEQHPECGHFGNRLREFRQQRGFSQEGLASLLGVHRTYLGGLERGERNPTLSMMVRLARGLRVPLSSLVDGLEEKSDSRRPRSGVETRAHGKGV